MIPKATEGSGLCRGYDFQSAALLLRDDPANASIERGQNALVAPCHRQQVGVRQLSMAFNAIIGSTHSLDGGHVVGPEIAGRVGQILLQKGERFTGSQRIGRERGIGEDPDEREFGQRTGRPAPTTA